MLKPLMHILALLLLLLNAKEALCQTGVYVPKKGKIFFKGDTATIFSDVVNEGKLGIGKKAVVNFKGEKWTNTTEAEIAADTIAGIPEGGWIYFNGTGLQKIDAGFNAAIKNGVVFEHWQLDNSDGVELIGSSAKVSKEIALRKGLFFINGQTLTVGSNHPGKISGYDSSKYIVTNKGGLLIREGISQNNDWVTFPIGAKPHSYTPAALRWPSELADDFYAAVTDSVRSNITSGSVLINEGVGKTWQIGKRFTSAQSGIEVALQHLNEEEGSFFRANKNKAYISQHPPTGWDAGYPQTHPGIGHLTTGLPLAGSGVNSRFFSTIGTNAFFTKLTGAGDTSRTRLWFNAYRLNRFNVKAYWQTRPELNVKYFVVQRRLSHETTFKSVDSIGSLALNGYSVNLLNYSINDPNDYSGISFYRLLSVAYNSDSAYSQVVAVGNKAGEFNSEIWPNPTSGSFSISINTSQPVKKIIIWDVLGQKVMELPTNGQRVIYVQAYKLAAANYYVSLAGEADIIIETRKLIIAR